MAFQKKSANKQRSMARVLNEIEGKGEGEEGKRGRLDVEADERQNGSKRWLAGRILLIQ